MSPTEELRVLAVRKTALRARIAARRTELSHVSQRLAGPVALLDRGLGWWRSVPTGGKWAAIPVGIGIAKKFAPKIAGSLGLLKYAPLAAQVVKSIAARRRA